MTRRDVGRVMKRCPLSLAIVRGTRLFAGIVRLFRQVTTDHRTPRCGSKPLPAHQASPALRASPAALAGRGIGGTPGRARGWPVRHPNLPRALPRHSALSTGLGGDEWLLRRCTTSFPRDAQVPTTAHGNLAGWTAHPTIFVFTTFRCNMDMLEIRQIRLIVTLAEHGNPVRAGRILAMSPCAVTRAVLVIGKKRGAPLFDRPRQASSRPPSAAPSSPKAVNCCPRRMSWPRSWRSPAISPGTGRSSARGRRRSTRLSTRPSPCCPRANPPPRRGHSAPAGWAQRPDPETDRSSGGNRRAKFSANNGCPSRDCPSNHVHRAISAWSTAVSNVVV